MQHQSYLLTPLDGGAALSESDAERQWSAAWGLIARACEEGLTDLHPLHPRRTELLALTKDARRCARLPAELSLRSA